MKKLLAISLALLFSAFLNAQGTLQFDRVIFEEFSQTFNPGTDEHITSSQVIINPGQVGKIVSCRFSNHFGTNPNSYLGFGSTSAWMELNNTVIFEPDPSDNGRDDILPIWLDEGTYTISLNNEYNDASSPY